MTPSKEHEDAATLLVGTLENYLGARETVLRHNVPLLVMEQPRKALIWAIAKALNE